MKKKMKDVNGGYRLEIVDRVMYRMSYILTKSGSFIANSDRTNGYLIAKNVTDKAAFNKFIELNPSLAQFF